VPIEDELRRPAYVVRVAQVDDDIPVRSRTATVWPGASRAAIAPPMAPAPPVTTATRSPWLVSLDIRRPPFVAVLN
jgi:hypothetical protein